MSEAGLIGYTYRTIIPIFGDENPLSTLTTSMVYFLFKSRQTPPLVAIAFYS